MKGVRGKHKRDNDAATYLVVGFPPAVATTIEALRIETQLARTEVIRFLIERGLNAGGADLVRELVADRASRQREVAEADRARSVARAQRRVEQVERDLAEAKRAVAEFAQAK